MKLSKQTVVIILLIILLVILNYVFVVIPENKSVRNHVFTIVKVTEFESSSEGGIEPNFMFSYKGRTYYGTFPIITGYEGKFKVGSKLFYKFLPEEPDNGKIIYDIDVPDTLTFPDKGYWKVLPKIKKNTKDNCF